MSEAMTYKLPPLPDECTTAFDTWWSALYPSIPTPASGPYDIWAAAWSAAIEAQGVPEHCDPSCTSYELAAMVMSDCGHSTNNQRLLDRIAERIGKHVEALLASAPPAQQASVVQQEPFGCVTVVRKLGHADTYYFHPHPQPPYLDNASECHTVYTHPAQQAKPQPLSDEQIRRIELTVHGYTRQPLDVKAFARAIESAACADRDARIAELERQLAEVRKQMDAQKDEWLSWDAKRKELEKDAERLNFIESMGYGIGWIARNSTTGRGYRLHNDKDGTHITARGAIDAAMKGTP